MEHETESTIVSHGVVALGLFAGGACGSLVRLALSALQSPTAPWPWMTTVINLTGAFLLGCITAYMAVLGPDIGIWKVVRLSLGTGLVGGYTTYSTFMLEVAKRLEGGKASIAVAYLLVSIVAGLLCALLGFMAGKAIGRWHVRRMAAREGNDPETEFFDSVTSETVSAELIADNSVSSGSAASKTVSSDGSASVNSISADSVSPNLVPADSVSAEPDRGPLLKAALAIFFCVALAALVVNEDWRHGSAFGLLIAASLLGGLGAFTRYSVDAWGNNHVHLPFPCGTIVVNLTACLAMGLVAGWCASHAGLSTLQYLLASGFLGGYSTFSTASVEGAKLVQGGKPQWALVHTVGMMVVSLVLLLLGLLV